MATIVMSAVEKERYKYSYSAHGKKQVLIIIKRYLKAIKGVIALVNRGYVCADSCDIIFNDKER